MTGLVPFLALSLWWLVHVRTPGAVLGAGVSGGWLFGRCPAAWRGAGPATLAGRGGQAPAPGRKPAGRPRRIPPRRSVGKEPPAAPLAGGPWPGCRRVTASPVFLVSRQRARPLPGPWGKRAP